MQTFKKVLLYVGLFLVWFISSYGIVMSNFFEFNFPMSLLLLFLPFVLVGVMGFYWRKK